MEKSYRMDKILKSGHVGVEPCQMEERHAGKKAGGLQICKGLQWEDAVGKHRDSSLGGSRDC